MREDMTLIAQITDLHLRPRGKKAYGVVDTEAMMRAGVAAIKAQPVQPDHGKGGAHRAGECDETGSVTRGQVRLLNERDAQDAADRRQPHARRGRLA